MLYFVIKLWNGPLDVLFSRLRFNYMYMYETWFVMMYKENVLFKLNWQSIQHVRIWWIASFLIFKLHWFSLKECEIDWAHTGFFPSMNLFLIPPLGRPCKDWNVRPKKLFWDLILEDKSVQDEDFDFPGHFQPKSFSNAILFTIEKEILVKLSGLTLYISGH